MKTTKKLYYWLVFLAAMSAMIFFGYRLLTGQGTRLEYGLFFLSQGLFVVYIFKKNAVSVDVKARNILARQISDVLLRTIADSSDPKAIVFHENKLLALRPLETWKSTRYLQGEFLQYSVVGFFCLTAGIVLTYSYFFSPDATLWELFYFSADSVLKGALADFLESYNLAPFQLTLEGFGFDTISFLIKTSTSVILIAAVLQFIRFKSIQNEVIKDLSQSGFGEVFLQRHVGISFALGFAAGKDYYSDFDRISRGAVHRAKVAIKRRDEPDAAGYNKETLDRFDIGQSVFAAAFEPILLGRKTAKEVSDLIQPVSG